MAAPDQHDCDVVILGGGPAGYSCALRASQLGLSVVLVEADKVGGTCLHRGCIPTKALLHAAEVADVTRQGATFGVAAHFDGIDVDALSTYRDGVVNRMYAGLTDLVRQHGITVVAGHGSYLGGRTVQIDDARHTGRFLVLATGSEPQIPSTLQLSERIITSDQALTLQTIPVRAVVVGGGAIGVEFASLWASFGAEVTIVEAQPSLLPAEDPWASKQLQRALTKRGICVRADTAIVSATERADGVTVELPGEDTLETDVVLIATGRAPRTSHAGLSEHGIALENGFVVTDDTLATSIEGVYAIGDIVRGLQLAHRGFGHGVFVAEHLAGLSPVPPSDEVVPRVVYSHPEVAAVGLTEAAVRERFGMATAVVYDLSGNAKSQILGTTGGVKVVRAGGKADDGPVLGVHLVGDRVSELIGEAQIVVGWEALASEVGRFPHAHPTQHEALGEAMLALSGNPLHAHG
jgi:dihydrolipoamide dehydrogenase